MWKESLKRPMTICRKAIGTNVQFTKASDDKDRRATGYSTAARRPSQGEAATCSGASPHPYPKRITCVCTGLRTSELVIPGNALRSEPENKDF